MGWTRQEVLDVARSTGMPVVEAWSDHDAGQMGTVVGPMLHHTGSAWSYPTYTAPTLKTVREGRPDLQNALCMYYIGYDGTIYCVTEKIAWHAGAGSWAGITDGNGHYAGIEAESDGVQWTKATVTSYKRLAAAILRKTGRTVAYAPRHADYALPKGRKTDFSGIDPATFLADVNADLTNSEELTVAQYDDIMAAIKQVRDESWQQHKDMANFNGTIVAGIRQILVGNHTDGTDRLTDLWNRLGEIADAVGAIGKGAALSPAGEPVDVGALAKALADEADRRARDNDPTTGPIS